MATPQRILVHVTAVVGRSASPPEQTEARLAGRAGPGRTGRVAVLLPDPAGHATSDDRPPAPRSPARHGRRVSSDPSRWPPWAGTSDEAAAFPAPLPATMPSASPAGHRCPSLAFSLSFPPSHTLPSPLRTPSSTLHRGPPTCDRLRMPAPTDRAVPTTNRLSPRLPCIASLSCPAQTALLRGLCPAVLRSRLFVLPLPCLIPPLLSYTLRPATAVGGTAGQEGLQLTRREEGHGTRHSRSRQWQTPTLYGSSTGKGNTSQGQRRVRTHGCHQRSSWTAALFESGCQQPTEQGREPRAQFAGSALQVPISLRLPSFSSARPPSESCVVTGPVVRPLLLCLKTARVRAEHLAS
jgi:hypothetical protein